MRPGRRLMAEIARRFRGALRHELDALVAGDRPDLLIWVQQYGRHGATLAHQPDVIWTQPGADLVVREDGSAWGVLPLWTTEESPSDLSVEFEVAADGHVTLTDLRVL